MKFGKDFWNHLEEMQPAPWRNEHLTYKALKKQLKLIMLDDANGRANTEGTPPPPPRYASPREMKKLMKTVPATNSSPSYNGKGELPAGGLPVEMSCIS